MWDTGGRSFTDFTMGWGSVLLGHAHPAVTAAVVAQAARGANFAYVSEPALVLAEEIARAVGCAERVRFCASGTEATAYAVRLARAFTGRPRVLKFEGAYHGANEVGTVSLFPSRLLDFPSGEPTSAGVTPGAVADILVAPYNDLAATIRIVEACRDELAGIIVEPLHRCTPPRPGFLQGLRELSAEVGTLLIFDETATGFRLAYGGAQEYYGVRPDLACLGKALGGGYPIGAVAGRGEVMDLVREDRLGDGRYVWWASSLGGNPVSTAAGVATLAELRKPGVYPRLFAARSPRSCSRIARWWTTAARSPRTGSRRAPSCSGSSGGGSSSTRCRPSSISRSRTTRATSRASSRRPAPPSATPCSSGSENRGEAAQVGAAV